MRKDHGPMTNPLIAPWRTAFWNMENGDFPPEKPNVSPPFRRGNDRSFSFRPQDRKAVREARTAGAVRHPERQVGFLQRGLRLLRQSARQSDRASRPFPCLPRTDGRAGGRDGGKGGHPVSIVTSGVALNERELDQVARGVRLIRNGRTSPCAPPSGCFPRRPRDR
jgi:hypothetical protein